jgi:hypothetical protein
MGGILGMILAAMPGSPVRKLVMNDVGSMIPKAAIERIGSTSARTRRTTRSRRSRRDLRR